MTRVVAAIRIPLALLVLSLAIGLSVFYAIGIVLPSSIGAGTWIALAVVYFLTLRANGVPLISLSRVCIAFYVYIGVMFFWAAVYPQVFIAVHSTSFQNPEIFAKANHLTAIGMSAFLATWTLAFRSSLHRPAISRLHVKKLPVSGDSFPILILLSLPLLVLSFPTASIFTAGYDGAANQAVLGAALEINVLKPALFICLLLALVSLFERSNPIRRLTVSALLTIVISVLGFANGNRVEELGCLLAIGWILQNRRTTKRIPKAWSIPALVLGMFMLVLGEVRSTLPSETPDARFLLDAAQRALQVIPDNETLKMKPSTNGDIALTLCVVIGMIDSGTLQIDHGETFWKYFEMTLPRFMNPERPMELQVLLQKLALTGGGLFVLAEPYVAGGPFGVMIVLGLFGILIGHLEFRYLSGKAGQWSYLLYLLLLSCTPRWFLYSTLSMYKHVLTGILIVLVVRFASRVISRVDPAVALVRSARRVPA